MLNIGKDSITCCIKTEEWLLKMMELVEMAKLMVLITEKTLAKCNSKWKPFVDVLQEIDKGQIMTYGFDDW